jgi:hypothetical protein
MIRSRFWVQARPGATGCGYKIIFTFYELGFPSGHFDRAGLGQGFKGSQFSAASGRERPVKSKKKL